MRAWPMLVLAACGFSEERFEVKAVDRWCELSAACAGTFDAETCVDVIRTTDRTGCTYDPVAGRDCFDQLPDAACVEDDVLDVRYLDVPEACELAYTCSAQEAG